VLTRSKDARAEAEGLITNNDYAIQIFQGPLVAPIRVTGLGGAYTASPEGVEGDYNNAAAPALREPFSHRWFDYDVNVSLSSPGSGTDFENRGARASASSARYSQFLLFQLGLTLQLGSLGVSGTSDLQFVTLDPRTADVPGLNLRIVRSNLLLAHAFFDDQFIVGAGIRGISLQITESRLDERALLSMSGIGPQAGFVIKPNGRPFRVGATVRAPVGGSASASGAVDRDAAGVDRVGRYIVPNRVVVPWEAEFGVAYQVGPRPLNPPWINPHAQEAPMREAIARARRERERARDEQIASAAPAEREALRRALDHEELEKRLAEDEDFEAERRRLYRIRRARYENWPREKILLLASVLLTGPAEQSVAVSSFLEQTRERFGRTTSVSPHVGIEGEPIRERLRARVGSYLEPSRWVDGTSRQHFTFGGDVKLFPFDAWGLIGDTVWRLSLSLDVAPRFTSWGVGLGAWR
jgi:hypothetical protein